MILEFLPYRACEDILPTLISVRAPSIWSMDHENLCVSMSHALQLVDSSFDVLDCSTALSSCKCFCRQQQMLRRI